MAKFLTTKGIAAKIEEIIRGAETKAIIVSPYLQISDSFFQRLKVADNSGVTVYIVYGKDDLNPSQWSKLNQLDHIKLFFVDNLHAKCYFNESEMVITSMNFYEYSEQNNIEMGISLSRRRDSKIYDDAINEVKAILEQSEEQFHSHTPSFPKHHAKPATQYRKKEPEGVCIRCREEIPYNPDRPYCRTCYSIWAEYENYDFLENYCHSCAKPGDSSMNKPECPNCYFN